ncbi:hypothetical protein ACIO02_35570 [Streptomyces sp. NPDC087568]|uniref:hypothetical protein n=1 Tax=Streptomyces sp. NPDC087568 TaxID=3365799 RepID=UPI00381E8AE9
MTFAPKTWVVGEVVTAALLNQEIRDQFNSFFATWTTYTPTWTSSGTAPNIGNGSVTGRYLKIGRTVFCTINLVAGTTTTFGSGNYTFGLPFQAANFVLTAVGSVHIFGAARWNGTCLVSPASATVAPFVSTSATNTQANWVTNTRPETLAADAQIRMSVVYEAAS